MTTFDPLFTHPGITLSNGDLTFAGTTTVWKSTFADAGYTSGRWAFEVVQDAKAGGAFWMIGIDSDREIGTHYPGNALTGWGLAQDGWLWHNGGSTVYGAPVAVTVNGNALMLLVDLDEGYLSAYSTEDGRHIQLVAPGAAFAGQLMYATGAVYNSTTETANFGATAFLNKLPGGFQSWDGAQLGVGEFTVADSGTSIVLSGGNLTATAGVNSWERAITDSYHISGKRCFEVTIGGIADQVAIGLTKHDAIKTGYLGQDAGLSYGHSWDGFILANSTPSGPVGGSTFGPGDVVMFMVDLDTGDTGIKINNGPFIASNTGIATATAYYAAISLDNVGASATINLGATPFVNALEPGYAAWEALPGAETLDPNFTDALITLSGNNLTATHANNNSWHRTSSQTPHTTGKWVFEVTANTNGSAGGAGVQISVGVIDDANRLSSGYLGQFGTSEAGLFWDGRGITNNSFSPDLAGDDFPLAGDVVMVHADLDAGVMYAKVNGGALVTSVPSFTPVGDIWAAIGLDGNASSATINFGETPFINTPEPGYNAWDAILGPTIVSGDITISWDVAEGLTAVPGTLEIVWDVYAFTVGELDVAWDVDALISPAPFVISWNVAESLESVSGQLKIMWNVEVELDVCRAFWVTKDGEGFWKGFKEHSACFSRGPLVNDQYGRYYLVRDDDVPRYTTFKVLELERRTRAQLVSSSYYRLGVPQPQKTPKVAPSGGTEDLTVDRSYVYTWVTAFGEEGPPSEPTVVSGADDGVWLVSNFDIDVPNASERLISTIRIYRTVTSNIGTVEYHFVAEIDFDDGDFSDDISTAIVGANFTLESANYFPPPEGLQNLVEHPNGFFVGNVGRDIYMSEPYLPHAWNPENTLSTLGDVVGFGVFGTSVVVGTKSYPYIISGISPSSMVLTQHDTAEPCLSRYGIVSMPIGVYYPGPNGLILVNQNGFNTITEGLMTKEEWQSRYDPANIDAARYQNSYVAFYSEVDGFLFTPTDPLYTFVELTNDIPICGLQTDEYSGKTIMSTGTELYEWNPPTGANMNYVWESKEFDVPDPVNFGAFRIIHYGDPVPTDAQIDKWRAYNALRIVNPLGPINWNAVGAAKREYVDDLVNDSPEWNQPLGGPVLYKVPEIGQPWPGTDLLTAEFYANDKLMHTKIIATDGMLRLPSGYKATRWRIRLTGSRKVKSVKIAETGRELRTV